jgi:hypothetical protein
MKMSMQAIAEQKTAAVEQKRRVSEAKVKSLLGMHSCSPPALSLSAASSSSPCPSSSSSSSVHHSHTAPAPAPAPADYVDHHTDDDDDGDAHGQGQGPGQRQGSVCPLEMRYGLGVQRPLAAFEAMSGVCFGTLTVLAPRLQEGWCLCEGEGDLMGLFEALSMTGAGTESGQAEGQEQEQREGRGHEKERDIPEGGAFRKSHVSGQMSSAALHALDLVRSYL